MAGGVARFAGTRWNPAAPGETGGGADGFGEANICVNSPAGGVWGAVVWPGGGTGWDGVGGVIVTVGGSPSEGAGLGAPNARSKSSGGSVREEGGAAGVGDANVGTACAFSKVSVFTAGVSCVAAGFGALNIRVNSPASCATGAG